MDKPNLDIFKEAEATDTAKGQKRQDD